MLTMQSYFSKHKSFKFLRKIFSKSDATLNAEEELRNKLQCAVYPGVSLHK